jgi:osmotically-inducible protein OsmY
MKAQHVKGVAAAAAVLCAVGGSPAFGHAATGELGDFWISTAMQSVMERDGRLDPGHVKASCRDGVVTLRGAVPTDDEKGLAEQLAMLVPGVRAIVNALDVTPPSDGNGRLAQEIRSALIESPSIHIAALNVRARRGVVTLTGVVREQQDRRLVDRLVMMSPHVRQVVDRLTILPTA